MISGMTAGDIQWQNHSPRQQLQVLPHQLPGCARQLALHTPQWPVEGLNSQDCGRGAAQHCFVAWTAEQGSPWLSQPAGSSAAQTALDKDSCTSQFADATASAFVQQQGIRGSQ